MRPGISLVQRLSTEKRMQEAIHGYSVDRKPNKDKGREGHRPEAIVIDIMEGTLKGRCLVLE